ncbi:long-chain-fatty-acid--CoA ligase FadD2 [Maricurvus nonylphenolicus]|uniref:AMP-binding protein n=1 Tax=Maricurvus nonylphenolicus TaxID=1008307 RepID=UPI0036F1D6D6
MDVDFWQGKRAPGVLDNVADYDDRSVLDVIERAFTTHGNKPAFSALGETLSFQQLDQASATFAAYVQQHTTLEPGDRIALQMPSVLPYLVALYGSLRAGLVIVNTNPLYTAREMQHQFSDSGARALVYMNMFGDKVEKVLPETHLEYLIEVSMGDMLPWLKGKLVNLAAKHVKKVVPRFTLPGAIQFNEVMQRGKPQVYSRPAKGPDDVALLQYTGGTTGVAKGAMILHRNLVSQVYQLKANEGALNRQGQLHAESGKQVIMCPLPLYHIYAFTVNCIAAFNSGNHSVLITNPRDIDGFIKSLAKYRPTVLVGINTLFVSLMEHPGFAGLDFTRLRTTVSGGTALNKSVAERWQELTSCPVSEGYGLTETSPTVCSNPIDGQGRIGTIGLPVPGTALKVVDEENNELGVGEVGELCVKGPQVMAGYWQRPEATAETIRDGWLHTGDIARIEEDGYVSIVDRKKDMILVSGFNVFPNEIEDVVTAHPKVELCACVGVTDAKSGEVPKLFVVKSNDSLSEAELKAYCRENLTGYKQPRHIEFRAELPMTAVGKVLRKDLRAEVATEAEPA